jgi:hypothetical protein
MEEGAYFCAVLTNVSLMAGSVGVKEALTTPIWNTIQYAVVSTPWFTPPSIKQKTERLFSPFSLS